MRQRLYSLFKRIGRNWKRVELDGTPVGSYPKDYAIRVFQDFLILQGLPKERDLAGHWERAELQLRPVKWIN